MRIAPFIALYLLSVFVQAQENSGPCPRTHGSQNVLAEVIYPDLKWYGSEALAVALKPNGYWIGMGPEHDYGDKLFWWSHGYSARLDPTPDLVVSGVRLDGNSPPAKVSSATNVLGESRERDGMLVGVSFPSPGCWEITGVYRGQVLKFVVEVGESHGSSNGSPNK